MKTRPLEGIKVLDFSQVLAAPFCGMMLADLGADVIKIERPGAGDISREYGPYVNDTSIYFTQYNKGKKGIAIDMRSPEGKKVVMDLVAKVDVVIENYKAGTLEKLGLGFEEMIKVNPQLIYGSIAGFGTYGPLSHLPCMDIIAAARSGLVSQTGVSNGPPIKPGFSMCDTWAGLNLLRGLSMALLNKQATGKGCRVDIAMLDCAFYMCDSAVLDHSLTGNFTDKSGNHDPWYAPHGEFVAKDGYAVIATTNEKEWADACNALGLSALINDSRFNTNENRLANLQALIAEMEKATSTMGRYEIEEKLTKANVPVSAIQTFVEFMNNEDTKKLNVINTIKQPKVGDVLTVSTPIKFSKTPIDFNSSAPSQSGAHSTQVLQSIGYSQEKIDELIASGAISQT